MAARAALSPRLDALRVRALALVGLLGLVGLLPLGVLWYGLPTLWRDYPGEVRRQWLSLLRGKTGPYRGVVW